MVGVSSLGSFVNRWSNTFACRASYGHGVPSQISRNQYDVPLPTIDMLVPQANASQQRVRAAHGYIFLCRLTEILGDLLPLVYGLQPKNSKETSKTVRRMRAELDKWEDSLPDWLRSPQKDNCIPTSGSSSLQLAFLAVKMLVCRIELQVGIIVCRLTLTEANDRRKSIT